MDSRIVFSGSQDRSERRKVFVEVTLKQDVDGHKIPLSIKWKNGTVYNVDIKTTHGELVYYLISPTNISVLSKENIEIKIWHLMQVLSAQPNIEISCIDSCERFDDNKTFMLERLANEQNSSVRKCLEKDIDYLDNIQIEMSTARQFMMAVRFRKEKKEQKFNQINRVEKAIAEQGFEVKRMDKDDIKRFLAIYFGASMQGELISDVDGEDGFDEEKLKKAVL